MRKSLLVWLVALPILWSCDRYVRENDTIYDVPNPENYVSEASLKALNDAVEDYPESGENYYKRA